jgi:nucleoside-diphosphate-sugar epimerase
MTKILISGGTGFVGANLIHKLIKTKNDIHVLVRTTSDLWRIKNIQKKVTIHKVDLLESKKLKNIIKMINPEIVFHLAAYGTKRSESNLSKILESNIIGTTNLLSSLESSNNLTRIVNIGSQTEYGIQKNNQYCKETDFLNPIIPYGIAKAAQTYLCNYYFLKKYPITTLRVFSPYGMYEDKGRLVADIMISLVKKEPLTISSPSITRDFIFIEDVVDALILASKKSNIEGEIINIGTSKKLTINELINLCPNLSQLKFNLQFSETKKRPTDRMGGKGLSPNINKACELLKWKPKFTTSEALQKTHTWFKKNIDLYE